MARLRVAMRGRGGPGDRDKEPDPERLKKRWEHGNAPRFFRSRFTGFHIFFQTVDIRNPGQMVLALSISAMFSLLATVLFFMMGRFERRAIREHRRRWIAAPIFSLRLLFLYCLVLLVEVMNIWLIFAVAVGHMFGWLLYHVYIQDCLDGNRRRAARDAPDDGGDGDDGDGKGRQLEDSSVSSQTSDPPRQFWDLA